MENYLVHHGVKGMHWGVRRYQNADGSYINAGKKRYGVSEDRKKTSYRESFVSTMKDKVPRGPKTDKNPDLVERREANRDRKLKESREQVGKEIGKTIKKGPQLGELRYRNANGKLTDKGIEKYAKKGFIEDEFKSNKTILGKGFDLYSQNHKLRGSLDYDSASAKERKARAEKYAKDHKDTLYKDTPAHKIVTAAKVVTMAAVADQAYTGGRGRKYLGSLAKSAGRMAYSAFLASNGHYDIRWTD